MRFFTLLSGESTFHSLMLKKAHRGLQSSDIRKLFQTPSKRMSNSAFQVLWAPSSEPSLRFSVIVSKKVDKSAVVRNRLRRQCYTLLSRFFSDWTAAVRVAIVVKTSARHLSPDQLAAELLHALKGAELL